MNYKEKYKQALERARDLMTKQNPPAFNKDLISLVFPELKESEDERIRKWCIAHFQDCIRVIENNDEYRKYLEEKVIAYLEKQGEQKTAVYDHKFHVGDIVKSKSQPVLDARKIISIDKDCYWCEDKGCLGFAWEDDYDLVEQKPTDKAEPKFKVGDWVILPLGIIAHIDSLNSTDYQVTITDGKICDFKISKQDNYHLWTIQDAKDGDVLVNSKGQPFIFSGKYDDIHFDSPIAYCGVNCQNKFKIGNGTHWTSKNGVTPATKEQRDLLFQKMAEEGYVWDSEKKELRL